MCREISIFMKNKNYSKKIETIGIVPIVAPKDQIDKGLWKEEIRYDIKFKLVYVSKRIEFNEYNSSNLDGRKLLIVKNILESVKAISNKGKLDYENFKKDLLEFLQI